MYIRPYRLGVKSLRCGIFQFRRAAGSIPATDIFDILAIIQIQTLTTTWYSHGIFHSRYYLLQLIFL